MASWDGLRYSALPIPPVTNGHFTQRREADKKCCQGQKEHSEKTRRNKTSSNSSRSPTITRFALQMIGESPGFPIAQLSDADFRKYGFKKDRSKDGQFWYERKEALKSSVDDPKLQKNAKPDQKSVAEIRLAEISAFQPFIAAYEKTRAPKSSEGSTGDTQGRREARDFRCTVQTNVFRARHGRSASPSLAVTESSSQMGLRPALSSVSYLHRNSCACLQLLRNPSR